VFHPDGALEDVNQTDLILIPAFLPVDQPLTQKAGEISEWLIDRYRARTNIAAMCTGTFMLAETGLLDGKIATTNWQFARRFQRRYPKVHLRMDRILTEEARLICTGAATSMYNLGLHLIRSFGSEELASVCSKALLVDPNRDSQSLIQFSPPGKITAMGVYWRHRNGCRNTTPTTSPSTPLRGKQGSVPAF